MWAAFRLLERAHVLGQSRLGRHWSVHLWMLRVGWRLGDRREVLGQLLRLALTPLGHLSRRLPVGNTGGSNVSAFASLPVPSDLQKLLQDERNEELPTALSEGPAVRAEPFNTRRHWLAWILLAVALAALDQATKALLSFALPLNARVEVTPWFNLVHVLNPGAAFSFLADAAGWQRYFLPTFGLIVSAGLVWMLRRGVRDPREAVAYAGLTGGALGNVIDRVRLGAVVDYLDFHWRGWHWPAFNLADILVVGSAMLLIIVGMFPRRSAADSAASQSPQHPERRGAA
jgi:signal peptidase II